MPPAVKSCTTRSRSIKPGCPEPIAAYRRIGVSAYGRMGEKANGRLERQLRRMVALLYAGTRIRRHADTLFFALPVFVPINRQGRERLANGHHRDRIDVDVSRSSDHPVDRVRYVF